MNNNEFEKKIANIKKEFQVLGGQISELASMSTERLEQYKNDAVSEVKSATKNASKEVEKQVTFIDEYAHKNPWAVIAGVSVVGLVAGLLVSLARPKK